MGALILDVRWGLFVCWLTQPRAKSFVINASQTKELSEITTGLVAISYQGYLRLSLQEIV